MNRLDFSTNWNNKLLCNCYTTFRIHNPKRFTVGTIFDVHLKDEFLHRAAVVSVRTITLDKVNDFVAMIDTGYSVPEFTDMVKKMYGGKVHNFATQKWDLVLLQELGEDA